LFYRYSTKIKMKEKQTLYGDQILESSDSVDDFSQHFANILAENAHEKSNYIEDDEYAKLKALLERKMNAHKKETIIDQLIRFIDHLLNTLTQRLKPTYIKYSSPKNYFKKKV